MTASVAPRTIDELASRLDTRLLDCFEVNLAAALVLLGVDDVRPVLGACWWFATTPDEVTGIRLDPESPWDRARRLGGVGVAVQAIGPGQLAPLAAEALAAGAVPIVISDAFVMPWVPYAGRKHVEHSFLVREAGGDGVVGHDLYDNRTEWGDAVPAEVTLARPDVAAVESAPGARIVRLARTPSGASVPSASSGVDPVRLLEEDVSRLAGWALPGSSGGGAADRYAAFSSRALTGDVTLASFDAFCEACWSIERRRSLYARWLADLEADHPETLPTGFAERFAEQVVSRWAEVNRFTYLSLRRIRAGRAPGPQIGDLIDRVASAEAALAAELVGHHAVRTRAGSGEPEGAR